jgi:hypothetical protein
MVFFNSGAGGGLALASFFRIRILGFSGFISPLRGEVVLAGQGRRGDGNKQSYPSPNPVNTDADQPRYSR